MTANPDYLGYSHEELAELVATGRSPAGGHARNAMPEPIRFSMNDAIRMLSTGGPREWAATAAQTQQRLEEKALRHQEAARVVEQYDRELPATARAMPDRGRPPAMSAAVGGEPPPPPPPQRPVVPPAGRPLVGVPGWGPGNAGGAGFGPRGPGAGMGPLGAPERGGAPGGVPMGGAGHGPGGEDGAHKRPDYLIEPDPDEVFGTGEMTAPPVIGE